VVGLLVVAVGFGERDGSVGMRKAKALTNDVP